MKEHKYSPGYVNYGEFGDRPSKNLCRVTWELRDKDGFKVFSMCAEIWQQNMKDILCGGQCVDTVAALFPNDYKLQRMKEIWERWHLNDMRAHCQHQRLLPAFQYRDMEMLEVEVEFHAFSALEKAAAKDDLGPEAKTLANLQAFGVKPFNKVLMDFDRANRLYEYLDRWMPGWKEGQTKYAKGKNLTARPIKKALNWLRPSEHPMGFLGKACPECGYKFGSAWMKEEIPADVIAEIESWSVAPVPAGWDKIEAQD